MPARHMGGGVKGCNMYSKLVKYNNRYGTKGGANSEAFHAFRRACGFYSLSLPFAAWWSPEESKDMGVRARLLRTHPSWSEHQRVRRAQMGGIMVSAGRHKSDCRQAVLHGWRPQRETASCGNRLVRYLGLWLSEAREAVLIDREFGCFGDRGSSSDTEPSSNPVLYTVGSY